MSSTAATPTSACWCFFPRLDPSACGGASALEALLESQSDSHLRVFVIWEPVLATDLSAPSTVALRRIHDPRVKQYTGTETEFSPMRWESTIVRAWSGTTSRFQNKSGQTHRLNRNSWAARWGVSSKERDGH